ncbi:MAG: multiheme c-type cytochrome [Nitrososphaerales archaeon]
MIFHMSKWDWLVLVPVAAILALVLALTAFAGAPANAAANAAANTAAISASAATTGQQDQAPVCKSCHAVEDAAWEASTHAKAGATCESCHGEYKQGHPAGETMTLPMDSKTCRSCHSEIFAKWENSQHGAKNVDCYDCHVAHSQGLRLEPAEKLCSACHTDEETKLAHGVHNISGINCVSCHMKPEPAATTGASGMAQVSNHSFTVASDVCAGCHSGSIHSEASAKAVEVNAKAEETVQQVAAQTQRISELEAQVNADQQRLNDFRNIAIVSMGLMLGLGGAVGLIVGVGATTLLNRRKRQ